MMRNKEYLIHDKYDSMQMGFYYILWNISIILSIPSPQQHHSLVEPGVWLHLLSWALQDTVVEAILKADGSSPYTFAVLPCLCPLHGLAEPNSGDKPMLLLTPECGVLRDGDHDGCCIPVGQQLTGAGPPEWWPPFHGHFSPYCLVQHFLHSTVIFCAKTQCFPLFILYPNVMSTVLMLSVSIIKHLFYLCMNN